MTDNTDNKNASRHAALQSLIVAHSSLGITAYDASGQCVLANPAAARLIGGTEQQLTEQNFRRIPSWQKVGLVDWAEKALAQNTEQTTEITVTTSFGKQVSLRCRFVPLMCQGDRYLMLIYEDITTQKQAEVARISSEARFRDLFNSISNAVAVYSAVDHGQDFVIVDFNVAAETIEKTNKQEIIGRRVTEVFPGVREFGLLQVFRRVWQTGTPEHHPVSLYQDERITGWRDNRVHKLPSGEVVAVYEDVTERKQAEEDLIKSEQRYHTLFENASDGIFLMQGIEFIDCNSRALEMFACTRGQIIGKTPMDFSPTSQPDGQTSEAKAQALLASAQRDCPQRFEWRHVRLDGTYFDAEVSLNGLDLPEQTLIMALVRDITLRKRSEKRLAEYQERLRSLAAELSLAEERLRRQIATWLHDHACQNLALVKMMLQRLETALSAPHDETAGEIANMVEQILLVLRNLTFDLSPPTLYMVGLEAAIEELLEEWLKTQHEIHYRIVHGKKSVSLPEDIRVLLYQSVRELIINITKHAQATEVDVTITTRPDGVCIVVQDNGIGFDTGQMEISQAKGFGLFNIHERLTHVGGQFRIESQPGQGSRFTLIAPLAPMGDTAPAPRT